MKRYFVVSMAKEPETVESINTFYWEWDLSRSARRAGWILTEYLITSTLYSRSPTPLRRMWDSFSGTTSHSGSRGCQRTGPGHS